LILILVPFCVVIILKSVTISFQGINSAGKLQGTRSVTNEVNRVTLSSIVSVDSSSGIVQKRIKSSQMYAYIYILGKIKRLQLDFHIHLLKNVITIRQKKKKKKKKKERKIFVCMCFMT